MVFVYPLNGAGFSGTRRLTRLQGVYVDLWYVMVLSTVNICNPSFWFIAPQWVPKKKVSDLGVPGINWTPRGFKLDPA